MKRASTPLHKLRIPFDAAEIDKLKMTYTQNDNIVLEKDKEDFTVDGNVWSVRLTQQETNLFKADKAQVQIRIKFTDGTVLPSDIFTLGVGPVLNDEVME